MHINPFNDNIVKKPREIEAPVIGLNESQLDRIKKEFEILISDEKRRLHHAVFVTSVRAGYGKSHLLGRLFRELNTKATLLYVLPFQDPESCWQSILLRAVQELNFPDRVMENKKADPGFSQIETISHKIIVDLTIKAIQSSRTGSKTEKFISGLKNQSLDAMRKNGGYQNLKRSFRKIANILRRLDINLNSSVESWLNVLFILAYEPDHLLNQACLDWLKGGSIGEDEAAKIGIRRNDLVGFDAGIAAVNEICAKRLSDMCSLMRPVRPFVFFFDETERYISEPLAEKFAIVVQTLVRDFENHMTVITANRESWEKISSNWQESQMDCLGSSVDLEGITREQGRILIENRLESWRFGKDERERMLSDHWLPGLFREGPQQGVRHFLKSCEKRWDQIVNGEETPTDLDDHFSRTVERIKSEKRRQVYDRDALRWLVEEAAVGMDGLKVAKYRGQKRYLVVRWKKDGRVVYFGFEDGSHWRQWQAIKADAQRHFESSDNAKSVFLRTLELKKIPAANWKVAGEIMDARKEYLHIVNLDYHTICRLYAARDVYNEAVSGDIPFSAEETLSYIQRTLRDFWELLLGKSQQEIVHQKPLPADPPAELTDKIKRIASREKILSFADLFEQLGRDWPDESLVRKGIDLIDEIKQYHAPNTTVLKWL